VAAARPHITPTEVRRVLEAVREVSRAKRIVLIGGQAVAWWVAYLETADGVALAGPKTSKDIDFEGDKDAAREVGRLLHGTVYIPDLDHHTPNTGLVVYLDPDGDKRQIDFLGAPLGLDEQDVRDTAILVEFPGADGADPIPLWVLHPERCMESRVANVMILRTQDQLALDQLRASIVCAQRFSALLLEDGRRRDVLDLNERIFRKCLSDRNFRALYSQLGIDPFHAVLLDSELGRFATDRYPQMQQALDVRRRKDLAAKDRSS
jgi:hypothetical protein